jgi:Uncharacterized conserved protein (DUF2190)
MSAMKRPIFTYSILAAAVVAQNLAVGYDGNLAAAGTAMLGMSTTESEVGVMLAVDVQGTSICTSGAAFAKGDDLEVGSNGQLITQTTGVVVARALEAATAANEFCEIMLLPK